MQHCITTLDIGGISLEAPVFFWLRALTTASVGAQRLYYASGGIGHSGGAASL